MAKDLLDLHGHREDQVIDKLDRFLREAEQNGLKRAQIMTGKGKGIVKKVVEDYLRRAKYPFQALKDKNGVANDGVLVVFLE